MAAWIFYCSLACATHVNRARQQIKLEIPRNLVLGIPMLKSCRKLLKNKNRTDLIAGLDAWEESGKLGDITYFNPVSSCGSNATQQLHAIENNKPMTYAGAASCNLSEAVKTAVERSFQVQRLVERDGSSLVIYNLAERSRDLADLHALIKTINCPVEIFKLCRTGKASSAGRPLRIFVSAPSDAERVLLHAHLLKDSTNYSPICIDK